MCKANSDDRTHYLAVLVKFRETSDDRSHYLVVVVRFRETSYARIR